MKIEKQLQNITNNVPGVVFQFRSTRDHVYSVSTGLVSVFTVSGLTPGF